MLKPLALALSLAPLPVIAKDLPPGITTPARLKVGEAGYYNGGVWNYRGDVDAYKSWLPKGLSLGFEVHSFCQDVAIKLYDRRFRLLRSSFQAADPQNAWVEYTATYEGGYYVQVIDRTPPGRDCSKDTVYNLIAAPSCSPTRKTKCTLPGSGVIRAATDKDWYRFSISSPGTYRVQASGVNWFVPGILSLRRADTSVIKEANDSAEAYLTPGNYFVALRMPQLTYPTQYHIELVALPQH